ncbi:MAG TPA: LuxR C-terminal-related transcriptional regulator [Enhygromyxa sp.]|nr:LuxR C-terminal-related transcriptional regulator [Enhygromyxa sp.]
MVVGEMTSNQITPIEVHIRVASDHDAARISSVLEALGYKVVRELDEGDGPSRLRWAVNRLGQRHRLTAREQDILERVLCGASNQEIGRALEISRATVKWHMHNLFAKTNTNNRESLLRLALQLGGGDPTGQPLSMRSVAPSQPARTPAAKYSEPIGCWAAAEDVTARIEFDQPRVPPAESIPSKGYA